MRCPDSAPVVWHACVTESLPEAPYLAILGWVLGWVGKQCCGLWPFGVLACMSWLPMLWDMVVGHASWKQDSIPNAAVWHTCLAELGDGLLDRGICHAFLAELEDSVAEYSCLASLFA